VSNYSQHHYSKNHFVGGHKLTCNLRSLVVYQNIFIAYSGGIDSHVLLDLCVSEEQLKGKLTAVYVNHGLQAQAISWGKHCEKVCENLGIKFLSLNINAQPVRGESPEEAARNARYAAFKPLLAKSDVLLLAQHAEDQLETVLLQLFRGSGLKGLSGMPESMPFGEGVLERPLLDVSKAAIIEYAKYHDLKWIEDPSNRQSHFDRNFLRNDVIPQLKQRWPALACTVSRSAKHCASAQSLIANMSDDWLQKVINKADNTLNSDLLLEYSLPQQQLIVRRWLQLFGIKMPSQNFVQRVLEEVVAAREGAAPALTTQGVTIRRYRKFLYCLKPRKIKIEGELIWPKQEPLLKVSENRAYEVMNATSGIPLELWHNAVITVKFRPKGETIQLPGRKGHHSLKNLYQEAGIPPWEREVMPLLYLDDKLVAVGEHWISAEFYCNEPKPCLRIKRHKINPKGNDDTPDVD
jgi:tRNA(Ile)-lysidine synthase